MNFMVDPHRDSSIQLSDVVEIFYESKDALGAMQEIGTGELPEPHRRLLSHSAHMTETLEDYHQSKLSLEVLHCSVNEEVYARNTILRRTSDGAVVQFGIARLDLRFLEPEAARQIREAQIPMGRVLMGSDLLRRVQPTAFWKIAVEGAIQQSLRARQGEITYARTAIIYCNGDPAVSVLECMPPQIPTP